MLADIFGELDLSFDFLGDDEPEFVEMGWREWMAHYFPNLHGTGYASRHERLWDWACRITPETARLVPRVEFWPRGGGKSTTAELVASYLLHQGRAKFILYVCETDDQARKHLQSIADNLLTVGVGRAVNEYGHSKGWASNFLHLSNGGVVACFGIESASRGLKVGQLRPDLLILDDIDEVGDSLEVTEKKETLLASKILPLGGAWSNILFVQNVILEGGVAHRMLTGDSEILRQRDMPDPEPAVVGLVTVEIEDRDTGRVIYQITQGVATWSGQPIASCEAAINDRGLKAFKRESQHEVESGAEFALWKKHWFEREGFRRPSAFKIVNGVLQLRSPVKLVGVCLGLDASVKSETLAKKTPDECGIVCTGFGIDGRYYVLADQSGLMPPAKWAEVSANLARLCGAFITYEDNQGGELIPLVIMNIAEDIACVSVTASDKKHVRAEPTTLLYEQGRVSHCGVFDKLERECLRWNPFNKAHRSPNRIDALVYSFVGLGEGISGTVNEIEQIGFRTEYREPTLAEMEAW